MRFDIITIFPEFFTSFLKESLIARAQKAKLIKIYVHDLRNWTKDRHKTVDDRPFGGGMGMVMKVEPIFKAVSALKKSQTPNPPDAKRTPRRVASQIPKSKVILFTPRGKKFNQKIAYQFSKLDQIIFICGRYEGVDERVEKYLADEQISIGDYVLMGGELPAMAVIEAISRLIPGVLGNPQILKERISKGKGFMEYPQYTRPPKFFPEKFLRARPEKSSKIKSWDVPKVLLSGHHKKIEEWRKKHGRSIEKQ